MEIVKELNVTADAIDITLKLSKRLQSKPSFHITYNTKVGYAIMQNLFQANFSL